MTTPTTNSDDGRDEQGRFTPGNRHGRGNPNAKHVAALRQQLLDSVTPEDIRDIVRKLVELAKAGDVVAIREVLNRTVGREPLRLDDDNGNGPVEIVIVQDPNWYGNADKLFDDDTVRVVLPDNGRMDYNSN